jgi:hypothetical protein
MPKPRIPEIPADPVRCEDCGKVRGYKGYAGPECQCDVKLADAPVNPWGKWPGPPG